ncbi:MAG: bifunctional rhamnulose-1-phosphate aldolase/short-chain dehydrogenase, partial [Deltaproteobacteria bacterium]
MNTTPLEFRHVNYLWDEEVAAGLDPVEILVYRSNQLGADQRITNTGGGNTSAKVQGTDPLTGEAVEVLWVKGSGGDLRTSKRENFASLYQDRLLGLKTVYEGMEPRGVKSDAEDKMVSQYGHCTFNLNPRATSIDTPLHSFLPAAHVDHMHPNSMIALAASRRSEELTRKIFGGRIGYVPWIRPGFELALTLGQVQQANPGIEGIIMGQHGIISWADTSKACYDLSLELAETAARYIEECDKGEMRFGGAQYETLEADKREAILQELMPWLRGQVSRSRKMIGTYDCREDILRYVNSKDAARLSELGTSCPDHFLRTKIKPLFVDWNPQTGSLAELQEMLTAGLVQYRKDYAAYYEACKRTDSPAMRDTSPTVILIPGIGMITWGKNKSESRVTAEFYNCAVEVMRGAEAMDEYIALPAQEAFDIEY